MKHSILILLVLLFSCSVPAKKKDKQSGEKTEDTKQETDYLLSITEVDNAVNVYVEDSLIFTTGTIHGSPTVDFKLDLNQYIITGNETLRIELWNGEKPYNEQLDRGWEIRYDLIIKGIIVDYVHEFGNDNRIGKVYENSYVINEWH